MVTGIGIDITEINRIETLIATHQHFLSKVLTPEELASYQKRTGQHRLEFAAGRFSAKEAYSKAFGTGIGCAVNFLDICILNNENGQPYFLYQPYEGTALISISHTDTLVMTQVLLEEKG